MISSDGLIAQLVRALYRVAVLGSIPVEVRTLFLVLSLAQNLSRNLC